MKHRDSSSASTAVSEVARSIAKWVGDSLQAAEKFGVKDRPVASFPLQASEGAAVAILASLPSPLKKKLVQENATWTVEEVGRLTLAIAESLVNAEPLRQIALLEIIKKLADCKRDNVAKLSVAAPQSEKEFLSTADQYPLVLGQAQRRAIAEISPSFTDRLKLEAPDQRTIPFSIREMMEIRTKAKMTMKEMRGGMRKNSLRHVLDLADKAIDKFSGIGSVRPSERLFQFKVTLKGIKPPIWRRIQVKDGILDNLHEAIQSAMGWTNSHLHQFVINGKRYGDPDLLTDDFEDGNDFGNSRELKISQVLPKEGKRFRFQYDYDFGDGWEHEILFEGVLKKETGKRYPICVEGERACPPEDVGGIGGYEEYCAIMADPEHEEHEEHKQWRGKYDPEKFDAEKATKRMRRKLPDWRKEQWM